MLPIQNPIPESPNGEPLDQDTLQDFANLSLSDVETALEWWATHTSDGWAGALDNG
jgi:hypothetical protein